MTARMKRLGLLVVLTLVTTTVVAASATTAAGHRTPRRADVDLISSAQPTPESPADVDEASDFSRVQARLAKADASATSSALCDGCTGDATTLQVLYLKHTREGTFDNVATAWSSCTECGATALSVQVVVLPKAHTVNARNRALATNDTCEGCATAAAAYQLVVVGADEKVLSRESRRQLQELVDQLAAELHATVAAPGAQQRRGAAPDLEAQAQTGIAELESLLRAELGAVTIERDVQLKTG